MVRIFLIAAISALLFPLEVEARDSVPVVDQDTVTIYLDTDLGSRKKGAAKLLTRSHQAYGEKGYRLIDMQIYIEDGGDQEGFFVTYGKRPSCDGSKSTE